MRIAIIGLRGYPAVYGGYETFAREFVPHAIASGHEVVVYCRRPRDGRRTWSSDGAQCVYTPGLRLRQLRTLSFGLTSALDLRRRTADVALIVSASNGYWVAPVQSAGIPAVLNVDGIEWARARWSGLGRAMFKQGARLAARHARILVADSRAVAAHWEDEFGVRPRFIPYGARIVAEPGDERLRPLGLEPGEYLLVVARLVPENNVGLAIDAWRMLDPASRPRLVIVGSAPERSRLKRELAELARGPGVDWLGTVADQRTVEQLWAHCALYLHGHSVGGTNPSLLQALGLGAPTIAFDTPFNREVLGEADAYYGPSAQALADRIRDLMDSEERRQGLRDQGLTRVREHYRWDRVCTSYLETLSEAASMRAGRRRP